MFRSLSTCSKYMQVRLSGKSREREGGSQEGTLGLSQEKGFEQLCIMKVRESEALHAEAWLEGEQPANAGCRPERWEAGGSGPSLPSCCGAGFSGRDRFPTFLIPQMTLLKARGKCLGDSSGQPRGKTQYWGHHTIWNSCMAQGCVLAYMLGESNFSNSGEAREMSPDD